MSDDKSTTDESVDEEAAEEPQPQESINASAESQRSDVQPQESDEDNEEEVTDAPDEDNAEETDDLAAWAENKGIDPNDPKAAIAFAKQQEQGFHKKQQQTSELKKELSKPQEGYNSTDSEQERLLDEMRLHSFYAERPDAREHDQDMAKIYLDYQQSQPEFARYLKRNLNVLHDMARARTGDEKVAQARQKGKKDALESTARSQASAAPKSNATNQADSSKVTAKKVQEWSSNKQDFMKHRDEIMAWEKAQMGLK